MPKRVIDFDAMWGSDKIASCAAWAQAEYAWLYGLADASGCFELTNLRVIWGRVAAIRKNLTIERLEQVFDEFQARGLLFVWEHEGKRYGHWTGSDVPGRLPAPSWRMRLERLAPPVPKRQLAEYVSRFARGRATLGGGGFRGETEGQFGQEQFENSNLKFEISENPANRAPRDNVGRQGRVERSNLGVENSEKAPMRPSGSGAGGVLAEGGLRSLKGMVEVAQAQDWNLNRNLDGNLDEERVVCAPGNRAACGVATNQGTETSQNLLLDLNSRAQCNPVPGGEAADQRTRNAQDLLLDLKSKSENSASDQQAMDFQTETNRSARTAVAGVAPAWSHRWRDKSEELARELAVGRGPGCGPVKIKPEALERIRAREAARRAGSRSP